jgi:hypothetical protein
MIGKIRSHNENTVLPKFDKLFNAVEINDNFSVVEVMKAIVPEFKSQRSEFEILDSSF